MINTPQDYQLVTPVGVIDGGILPARDVAADGSAHTLRAEDDCFLAEAGRRICAYRFSDGGHGGGEPSLVRDRGPFRGAIDGIHEGAVSNNASATDIRTWPNVPVLKSGGNIQSGQGWRYIPDFVQFGTNGLASRWDGCLTTATVSAPSDFMASTLDFSGAQKSLLNDNVRKIYHDLNTVKGVVADGGTADFSSGATKRSREWRSDGSLVRDVTTDYSPGTQVISAEGDSGFFGPTQIDFNWTATGVRNPMTHPERLAALSPTSCWALWRVWTTFNPESGPAVKHEDGFVLDASITVTGDLAFSAPVSSAGLLQMAKAAHPGAVYDSALSMPDYSSVAVNAALVGVMFYDSGIDFSALGWTWPIQQGGN